jgi:Tfp pilus assembly protein PilP
MRSLSAVALLLLTLAAAGCGESAEDKAMADVCAARADISKQVDKLASLTPTTATTTEVRDGLQAVRDDLSNIADARKNLSDDRRKEVEQANTAFAGEVRDTLYEVGTSVSIESAGAQLTAAFQQLKTSYGQTFARIDCS